MSKYSMPARINDGRLRTHDAGIVVLLFIAAAMIGCDRTPEPKKEAAAASPVEHKNEVKLTAEAIKKYGIVVEPVKKQVLVRTLTAPGRVSFNTDAMAHVGAVLRGRATELKVKKGDKVNKGDELLVVESPELGEAQSDFIQKRTSVETARPAVDLAKSAYERAKSLYEESKGIALTELQKREADYRAAQGALQSAQSAATAAENKLHLLGMDQSAVEALAKSGEITPHYTVRAPISGQVVAREVTLGELVNPDKEALLVLADMSTLWVLADVPEAQLKDVIVGTKATVKVSASPSEPMEGTVSYIDPSLDPNTRSARVRVVVKGGTNGIRPGMFAQVEIEATRTNGAPEAVLAIPDEAIQTVEGEVSVFVPVAGEENTFTRHSVVIGKAIGGLVPVISGLKDADQIVSRGSFVLKAELGKGATEND